jgi:hypothetical protein
MPGRLEITNFIDVCALPAFWVFAAERATAS